MVNIIKIKRWLEGPQKVKYGTVVKETVVKGLILEGILGERFTNEKTVAKGSTVEDTVNKKKNILKTLCFILLNMFFHA